MVQNFKIRLYLSINEFLLFICVSVTLKDSHALLLDRYRDDKIKLEKDLTLVCRVYICCFFLHLNPLSAKKSSKVKVTICQRTPRLPASLITFQFHSLVISLSDIVQEHVFMTGKPLRLEFTSPFM